MGKLTYGRSVTISLDDRTMWHLQAVMVAKLRFNEGFVFSWDASTPSTLKSRPASPPPQYGVIWVSKASARHFEYDRGLLGVP